MKKIKLLLLVVLFFSACKKDEDFRIDYTTRKFDIDKYSPILKAQNDKTISKRVL